MSFLVLFWAAPPVANTLGKFVDLSDMSSFATPIDSEDIYRAIAVKNSIVTYFKSTYNEMKALEQGCFELDKHPENAERHAFAAKHSERLIEKMYRKAIAKTVSGRRLFEHVQAARTVSAFIQCR